jgi:phenylpyruvate tautomerase PptA (4-oxalocrotonate tautomerase family)
MPLVRISLRQGKSEEYKRALADGVHRAIVEGAEVPPADRFQIITEHPDIVMVQITLSTGRKLAQKRRLMKRMAQILAEDPGLRPQDLMINLMEVAWENWSFGDGAAQYTE